MEPLIALIGVTFVLSIAGRLGAARLKPPATALRGGLAVMFLLTGGSHMIGMREELVAMVPPVLPAPELLVTLTGLLEIAGAAGLLWRRTRMAASGCLSLLMVVMFPANVYGAVSGLTTAWYDQLFPRTVMQVIFIGASLTVFVAEWRHRRAAGAPRQAPPLAAATPPHPDHPGGRATGSRHSIT